MANDVKTVVFILSGNEIERVILDLAPLVGVIGSRDKGGRQVIAAKPRDFRRREHEARMVQKERGKR